MLIRVGSTVVPDPDGNPREVRVIQALDPETEFPVAQIAVPIEGGMAEKVGLAIAGKLEETGIVVPGEPGVEMPPDMRG